MVATHTKKNEIQQFFWRTLSIYLYESTKLINNGINFLADVIQGTKFIKT